MVTAIFNKKFSHKTQPYGLYSVGAVVWCADAFSDAIQQYGYCCDVCKHVTQVAKDKVRIVAERCLANLDGRVKLLLCVTCKARYTRFCNSNFGDDSCSPYSEYTEKKMIGFIAHRVTIEYKKYIEKNNGKLFGTMRRRDRMGRYG